MKLLAKPFERSLNFLSSTSCILHKLSSIFASVIVAVLPHKLIKHPIWSLYIEIRK